MSKPSMTSLPVNEIQLAKGLGMAGVAVGAFKLFAGRRISRLLGAGTPLLVRLFGIRNIASSVAVLAYPDNPAPVWTRVAGDAVELAVLAAALGSHNRRRHGAAWATLAIGAAFALDIACASALQARGSRVLATARRTRIKRIGTA